MLIHERIKVIMSTHQMNAAQFADKIGVKRSNMSHILSGRNKPGFDFLEKVIQHFPRVNASWLLTGGVRQEEPSGFESMDSITNNQTNRERVITQILLLYSDGTFEKFNPNGQ